MKKTKLKFKIKAILLLFAIFPLFFLSGCGCKQTPEKKYSLDLEIWGLFDDSDVFSDTFENYKKINPNIKTITYKKLSPDTYEKDLLEALASDQGPDIFLIRNVWADQFSDKLSSAPATVLNEKSVRDEFVDVVAEDFVKNGEVLALPLSVDSLNLFYNKDIFNKVGISAPPKTWKELEDCVKKINQVSDSGEIIQSGVALGTAYNINRSVDILSLLLFQNGNEIYSKDRGTFYLSDPTAGKALEFYTQFSNSGSDLYSWNPRMHYSVDAFSEGNLAMMLNYSWQIPIIKNKSPKLNFAVSEVPQNDATKKIGYANYWGYGVSKKQPIKKDTSISGVNNEIRIEEAWKLIKYMAMTPVASSSNTTGDTNARSVADFYPASDYAEKTGKPSGKRDILEIQKNDTMIAPFVLGNLYAKSFLQTNSGKIESVLAETIEKVVLGKDSPIGAMISANSSLGILLKNN